MEAADNARRATGMWPEPTVPRSVDLTGWIVTGTAAAVLLLAMAMSLLGLHAFDHGVVHLLNTLSRRSAVLDNAVFSSTKDMFSNLLMVSLIWFAWFGAGDGKRAGIAVGVVMSYAAGVISRVMQLMLPTHLRPLHDPALGFRVPIGVDPNALNHWASFPSDHAAVFFGLVATLFFANRRLGWIALALAVPLSCVRIYLGFHFPTDVIAGAAVGIVVVGLSRDLRLSGPVNRLLAMEHTRRPWFYAVSFYFCFGIATLFNDYRDVAVGLAHAVKMHVPH